MHTKFLFPSVALALLPCVVTAQTGVTTEQTPTVATPVAPLPLNPFEVTPIPVSEQMDYRLLYNDTFNDVDLQVAQAHHYSDRQIAEIYKIAKITGRSFRDIYARVCDGCTFATLADSYGFNLRSLDDIQREQDEIDSYESAYAGTGVGNSPRPNRVMSSVDSIKH